MPFTAHAWHVQSLHVQCMLQAISSVVVLTHISRQSYCYWTFLQSIVTIKNVSYTTVLSLAQVQEV